MPDEHLFLDSNALFSALHAFCVDSLLLDLESAPQVSCFFSGGSTPLPLFNTLAPTALPWQRIHPALVDERWVEVSAAASNEGLLRHSFRHNPAFLHNLCTMKDSSPTALDAETQCSTRYAALPSPWSFCLLGMGVDGHVASLFPGAQGLHEALHSTAMCKAITANPSAVTGVNTERMSMTLAALLRARRIILLFTGGEKWQVYQQALQTRDPELLPASAVLHQTRTPVHIFHCK